MSDDAVPQRNETRVIVRTDCDHYGWIPPERDPGFTRTTPRPTFSNYRSEKQRRRAEKANKRARKSRQRNRRP